MMVRAKPIDVIQEFVILLIIKALFILEISIGIIQRWFNKMSSK